MFKYIFLFLATFLLPDTYYYSNGKKVVIAKKPDISRNIGIKNCYSHIGENDNLCLENEIIVFIDENKLSLILKKYNLVLSKKLLEHLFLVKTKDYKNTLEIANNIQSEDGVKYAYPNFASKVNFRSSTTPLNTPDPYGRYAWHLKNTGQGIGYKIGADIKVERAWLNNKGVGIKVGMIDDGIEISHPDVVYSDGYSVSNPSARTPEHYTTNTAHHGTKAASLIVAKSNSVGSIGVAPEALLYIINVDGSPKVSDLVSAFTWLKDNKVDVISNSWGSYKTPDPIRTVVEDIIKTGRKGKGTPIVFAVGNDRKNLDDADIDDESEIDGVISVAASSPYDNRYVKSNYGKNLTLVAPGVDLIVARQDITKNQEKFSKTIGSRRDVTNQLYVIETGTSLSAPIVAGGVALMLYANKDISASAIKDILQNTSDKIATNEYSYDTEGRNNYYGYGRLNLADAVRSASLWKDPSTIDPDMEFTLNIKRGWNLLSIPVDNIIYQKDFARYFGVGHKVIKLEDNAYNHYVKIIFPEDGFYLYSPSATAIVFHGDEYNASFENAPTVEGWNLLGVGKDVSVSKVRAKVTNSDYLYFYRNGKFSTSTSDEDNISRGEGFFLYKFSN